MVRLLVLTIVAAALLTWLVVWAAMTVASSGRRL